MGTLLKKIAILCVTTLVGACASPDMPRQQTTPIPRGEKPGSSEAQQLVMPYLKRSLKDYQFISGPHPTIATNLSGEFQEVWMICVEYNAKNSYGGYIGITTQTIPLIYSATGELAIPSQEN